MRDWGEIEAVQSVLPEWAMPVIDLLTTLGDVWFLVLIACLAYWLDERERGVYTFALILGGLALIAGAKAVFAVPRPPVELHLVTTETTSFPSGHATGAAVVYGALALTVDRFGTRNQRLAGAAVIVVLVGFSRIALGVHYAADVLAGIAVGVAYLTVATRVARGDPHRAFALGAVIAILGATAGVLSGPTPYSTCFDFGLCLDRDALAAVVGTTSALAVWTVLDDDRRPSRRWYSGGIVALALVASVPLLFTVGLVDPPAGTRALVAGLAVVAVLCSPLVVRRDDTS